MIERERYIFGSFFRIVRKKIKFFLFISFKLCCYLGVSFFDEGMRLIVIDNGVMFYL